MRDLLTLRIEEDLGSRLGGAAGDLGSAREERFVRLERRVLARVGARELRYALGDGDVLAAVLGREDEASVAVEGEARLVAAGRGLMERELAALAVAGGLVG